MVSRNSWIWSSQNRHNAYHRYPPPPGSRYTLYKGAVFRVPVAAAGDDLYRGWARLLVTVLTRTPTASATALRCRSVLRAWLPSHHSFVETCKEWIPGKGTAAPRCDAHLLVHFDSHPLDGDSDSLRGVFSSVDIFFGVDGHT